MKRIPEKEFNSYNSILTSRKKRIKVEPNKRNNRGVDNKENLFGANGGVQNFVQHNSPSV